MTSPGRTPPPKTGPSTGTGSDSDSNQDTTGSSNNSSFNSGEVTPLLHAAAMASTASSVVTPLPLTSKSPRNWRLRPRFQAVTKRGWLTQRRDPALEPARPPRFTLRIKEEKGGLASPKELLRRRYMILYRTLMDYVEPDGRVPITIFMEKPSKKLYPSYYKIISESIDMIIIGIENYIKMDKYATTDALLKDFTLMFDNCRQYNEEGSLIYEDANTLEKLVHHKIRELGPEVGFKTKPIKYKNAYLLIREKLAENIPSESIAVGNREQVWLHRFGFRLSSFGCNRSDDYHSINVFSIQQGNLRVRVYSAFNTCF